MARTTIDLDPGVVEGLRRRGAAEGKSMGRVASELLARSLDDGEASTEPALQWASRDLGRPLVDLEDKEAVRKALADE